MSLAILEPASIEAFGLERKVVKLKSILAAMTAMSLVVPSLAVAQVGTPLTQSNGEAAAAGSGFSNASFIVLGLAALSFAGVFVLDDGDDNTNGDRPNSP